MKELEYLLSDIPDEEKTDAIGYYRDYMEEAGPENEEKVIREFGSPERIAAIIRSDMAGNLAEGGEFTENGYQDERFRDPNYQVSQRLDLPEVSEKEGWKKREKNYGHRRSRDRRTGMILWIILLIVASPILLGIGGGLFGLAAGLLGGLLGVVAAVGALTFALFAAGIVVMVGGITSVMIQPLSGILLFGLGILIFGIGLIALAGCAAFYGSFLPFLFRVCINGICRLIHGRRKRL